MNSSPHTAATAAEPRWLDADEQHAWRSFLRMHTQLTAQLGRAMQQESELSMADFAVLVELTDVTEGRLRVLELARELQWEKSRLSHHLGRMEKRGLVAREECASDKRGSWVVITAEGRRAIEAAAPRHVELVRTLVFDRLSAPQVAALAEVSDRILAGLEGCPKAEED
ncbi:MarR family winged helix-turn-helix transcriptional regulator [Streptacidiphilus monticola]|jgi:DNA-binding MarR family transcriptional regulator|uniref:MarR family winged helix-turn-helix transcriptional regulator n=1 Tax=Streptacidiphilus monticola TaxID=2161674 RepID=A0ABW1G9J8_9ACTN